MASDFYTSFDTETWEKPRKSEDYRSPFQVDRDRVLFTESFRRLQSKTQVFQSGEYDFYRTRLTHSIEVARIARSICHFLNSSNPLRKKGLTIDPDLVEAIGLAHDIGHPPFGHIGERKLNELMTAYGGFEGNAQTLRILTRLIYPRPKGPTGMRPTRAFADGVLKYKALFRECLRFDRDADEWEAPANHFLYDDQAKIRAWIFDTTSFPDELADADRLNGFRSLECQIMDWADDAAYSLHDIGDGFRAGFITVPLIEDWRQQQEDLSKPQQKALDALTKELANGYPEPWLSMRLGEFVQAIELVPRNTFMAEYSQRYAWEVEIDPDVKAACRVFKDLAVDLIFRSPTLQQIEFKGGYILQRLFDAYRENYVEPVARPLKILPQPVADWVEALPLDVEDEDTQAARMRVICDYVSSMTDSQALKAYRRLFDADFGSISDLA